MTTAHNEGWRTLSRLAWSKCPKLFYAFSATHEGFTLRLTDLVAIWQCHMNREETIGAARDQESSIDPSESNAQLLVLLGRLQQSLESGNNRLYRNDGSPAQAVHLSTEMSLPKPLKPLAWTFRLEPQDAGELAEQLLRPCLHEASVTKQKLDTLLRVIKDKDHVISRLLEKVENLAIDLSLIFPGIVGLKSRGGKITVADAKRHVPGMSLFDLQRWLTGFDVDSPYIGYDKMGMSNLVAGCERCHKHTVEQHASWYNNLPLYNSNTHDSRYGLLKRGVSQATQPTQKDRSSDVEDDFERQPTPPRLRRARNGDMVTSGSSDSEDLRPAKKVKLGKIGGSRNNDAQNRKPSPPSSSPAPDQTSCQSPGTRLTMPAVVSDQSGSETETASESDSPARSSAPRRESELPRQPQPLAPFKSVSPISNPPATRRRPSSSTSHNPSARAAVPSSPSRYTPDLPPKPTSSSTVTPQSTPRHRLGSLHRNSSHLSGQTRLQEPNTGVITGIRSSPDLEPIDPNLSNEVNIDKNPSRPQITSDSTSASTSRPSTPTHRLGRLSTISSRSRSKTNTHSSPHTPRLRRLDSILEDDERDPSPSPDQPRRRPLQTDPDSDASTASASPPPPPSTSIPENPETSATTASPAPDGGRSEEKEETADQKADRRRAELKRRLGSGGPPAATGGLRKKRKF